MNTINTIKTSIAAAEAAITNARPLADQLAAMQAAAKSIATATETLAHLHSQLAVAEKAEQVRATMLARYSVESIVAGGGTVGPATRHTVTFSERISGLYGPEVRTLRFALDGLSAELLAVVLADLDKVPAYLLALDADPAQAIRKHAQAVNRGYVAG